jgi:glycosyltransferase involved in cell wall biosynthesis
MPKKKNIKLGFCTTCYNEEDNVERFCSAIEEIASSLIDNFREKYTIDYEVYIADNCSTDNTRQIIKRLSENNQKINPLFNYRNYGPEISAMNTIKAASGECDMITLLCSDLQDPPCVAQAFLKEMIENPSLMGIIGIKARSIEGWRTKKLRRLYYKTLNMSSRLRPTPAGFHGFGCYRAKTVNQIIELWDRSELNLRQCITNSGMQPKVVEYTQSQRPAGKSTYNLKKYTKEALKALAMSDATGSRLAIVGIGIVIIMSGAAAIGLLLNYILTNSLIGTGIPTLVFLVQLNFTAVLTVLFIIALQLENARNPRRLRVYSYETLHKNDEGDIAH